MVSIGIIKPLTTVLSSAVNKPQQNQEKNSRNAENRTQGCWVRSANATSVSLCYAAHGPLFLRQSYIKIAQGSGANLGSFGFC